jgi:hypothetical protein
MGTPQPHNSTPRRKSKTLLFVLLGVGIAMLLCCGGGTIIAMQAPDSTSNTEAKQNDNGTEPANSTTTNPDPTDATTKPAEPTKAAPAEAGIGTPVRDGKFEFVVQKVECGKNKVGGEYLNKTAQGQFCLITVSVKNIGNKPQSFSDSSQKAFSDKGAEYATDSGASLYANTDQQVWLNDINPGNVLTGIIVFDIPKDSKIARLELHDSMFSGGVEVKVG